VPAASLRKFVDRKAPAPKGAAAKGKSAAPAQKAGGYRLDR